MFHRTGLVSSLILVTAVTCTACSGGSKSAAIHGGVEKGPFILGSSVTASVVDAHGNPTGASFATQTSDEHGSFSLANVPVGGVSFQAEGFYYDEVLGTLSTAPITLRSFHDVTSTPGPAFVNVVTHLAHDRVQTLLGEGVALDMAIPQAEGELVTALGIGPSGFTLPAPGSSLDEMGGDDDANAYLFAISTVFVQAALDAVGVEGPVDAKVQEMLDEVAAGLASSGTLPSALTTPLQTAATEIDVALVESLFADYLASVGVSATVPDLTRILSGTTGCVAATTLPGSITIRSSLDVNALAPYRCISGDVTVDAPGLSTVSLPRLQQIGGSLSGSNTVTLDLPALTSIGGQLIGTSTEPLSLPALTSVGGTATLYTPWDLPALATAGALLLVDGSSPTGSDLPALTSAGGVTVVSSSFTAANLVHVAGTLDLPAPGLTSLSLPSLQHIDGALTGSSAAVTVTLPALTTIGGTVTMSAGSLSATSLRTSGNLTFTGSATLDVPSLQSAGSLFFGSNQSVSLPALTTAENLGLTGAVAGFSAPLLTQLAYVNVYDTRNLTTLSLPSLTTVESLGIYGLESPFNAVLTHISFPALATAGIILEVFQNPALPQCQADAIHAQVVAAGWSGTYIAYGNGSGTCP